MRTALCSSMKKGNTVDGDQVMAVIGEAWHRAGRLSGRRRSGDRDVQSGPRALHARAGPAASPDQRSAIAMFVEHMRAHGLNVGGGTVRPRGAVGLFDDR